MQNGYEKLLKPLEQAEPPARLYSLVCLRIANAQLRRARVRLALFCGGAFLSFAALFPAVQFSATEFSRSNFMQYVLLTFSDSSMLLLHWKELSLSLVESLPPAGLTLVLAACLGLLFSLRLVARYVSDARLIATHPLQA